MAPYLRNRLTHVWAFLTTITLASWWIGRGHSAEYQLDPAVTLSVLAIAALKAQLVMRYFMELRFGPAWLKRVAYGWVILLFLLLLAIYWAHP